MKFERHFLHLLIRKCAAVFSQVAHEGGGDAGEFRAGGEDDRLQLRSKESVRVGHIALIVEIGCRARSAQKAASSRLKGGIDGESMIQNGLYSRFRGISLFYRRKTLARRGLGIRFLNVYPYGDDDFVEQSQASGNNVGMSRGEGVEAAGEKSCPAHLKIILVVSVVFLKVVYDEVLPVGGVLAHVEL